MNQGFRSDTDAWCRTISATCGRLHPGATGSRPASRFNGESTPSMVENRPSRIGRSRGDAGAPSALRRAEQVRQPDQPQYVALELGFEMRGEQSRLSLEQIALLLFVRLRARTQGEQTLDQWPSALDPEDFRAVLLDLAVLDRRARYRGIIRSGSASRGINLEIGIASRGCCINPSHAWAPGRTGQYRAGLFRARPEPPWTTGGPRSRPRGRER